VSRNIIFVIKERMVRKDKRKQVRIESYVISTQVLSSGREGRKSVLLLEGSQAVPASPSDKSYIRAKTLEWLEAVALD
jgi:hypothetical protein